MPADSLQGIAASVRGLGHDIGDMKRKIEAVDEKSDKRSEDLSALTVEVGHIRRDVEMLLRHLVSGQNGSLPLITKMVIQEKSIAELRAWQERHDRVCVRSGNHRRTIWAAIITAAAALGVAVISLFKR